MDNAQLMKGILEGCVSRLPVYEDTPDEILGVLADAGFEELGEGTLYPVLTRLDKNGLILCRKAKSPLGPVRKYYSVTEAGKKELEDFIERYRALSRSAEQILNGKESDL